MAVSKARPSKPKPTKKASSIKRTRKQAGVQGELVLDLAAPGLTTLLRAGLGGLASSLRALAIEDDPECDWPCPVPIADGSAVVESRRVTFHFGPKGPARFLEDLFARVFEISRNGVIAPRGILDPTQPTDPGLQIAFHLGMKRTFLQHGKSTTKRGSTRIMSLEIDDRVFRYSFQPYSAYAHQEGASFVLKAMTNGTVELAGWAYPGAAQKHIGISQTKCEYGPVESICAFFTLIGCLSLPAARGGGGVLVIPHPDDLVAFAITRPRINPRSLAEAHVTGVGDAVLAVQLALRLDEVAAASRGVAGADGLMLRALPWATQQKSRAWTISTTSFEPTLLDAYEAAASTLPSRILDAGGDDGDDEGGGFFVATSALRGFVTDNLAEGRRWYAGFGTATTGGSKPRFIHYYRDKRERRGLGALYPEEKRGIIAMLENLDHAEEVLVRSVHVALRQRFAQVASEAKDSKATRQNRFTNERERWRLAFAGSKTADQIRAALADLWSRAGINTVLRENWEHVLPLLRAERWQIARDLALVALASYQRQADEPDDEDDNEPDPASD